MPRRVFISFHHSDRQKASGFNLLRWNDNVDIDVVGRHLLSPVDSENESYIGRKIREQITNTSVTVVIIGRDTHNSDWVDDEIGWSLDKGTPNGLVGIMVEPECKVPDKLVEAGAEILPWYGSGDSDEFGDAIERAAIASGRAKIAAAGPGGGSSCSRRYRS